jgi:hypothetical protein
LALSQEQLNALARHGAQARINELRQEVAAIEQAFPELRSKRPGRPSNGTRQAAGANGAVEAPGKRRRRGWSAVARKAAAARMKAYWAKRKAGRKK